MIQKSYDNSPTLYIVPTPIGNLDDMTYRAVKILQDVDKIGCEDTRTSGVLLKHYNISTPTFACHDHNQKNTKQLILSYLDQGQNIALISDAGMPGLSDPGYEVIKYIIENGYNVVTIPGANAGITALVSSGIVPQPFLFYGFLNNKKGKKAKELKKLEKNEETIIFYESPHRIKQTVEIMYEVLGDRQVTLAREISKKFEEYIRCNLSTLIEKVNNIKGEIVLVVDGYKTKEVDIESIDIKKLVNKYINEGLSKKEAIKKVSVDYNIKKSDVYNTYHN